MDGDGPQGQKTEYNRYKGAEEQSDEQKETVKRLQKLGERKNKTVCLQLHR